MEDWPADGTQGPQPVMRLERRRFVMTDLSILENIEIVLKPYVLSNLVSYQNQQSEAVGMSNYSLVTLCRDDLLNNPPHLLDVLVRAVPTRRAED